MLRREVNGTEYNCPTCGAQMVAERGILHCADHGTFFAYGPQLLVRIASENRFGQKTLMPWESSEPRRS